MAADQLLSHQLRADRLFRLSVGVFFIGGFLSSIVSLLVPRLKLLFGLGYAQALLVQFSFHSSYLLFALPIAVLIVKLGYMRAIATGLAIMASACALLLWAHGLPHFGLVLLSLTLLSCGITFLQIASNTVVTVVGRPDRAAGRLTLLQSFNSLGTVAGPLLCAPFLLTPPARPGAIPDAGHIGPPFLGSIAVLAMLALAFAAERDLLPRTRRARVSPLAPLRLVADRRVMTGAAAIFVYVGAEVTVGTLLTNYLTLPEVLGMTPVAAGRMVSLYWGGAMIGRFAGAFALRHVPAPTLLAAAAAGATLLTLAGVLVGGAAGAAALIAVGLCNAIMYPTIYALALPADDSATPAATLLCMAVVGGAIVPYVTGVAADRFGLSPSLLLPAACYLGIGVFARGAMRDALPR